jgi:hypothetical protein
MERMMSGLLDPAARRKERMTRERIIARRVTLDEFCNYMGKLEYIKGRIVTGPGIELFVGVKEFPESIRALEEEKKRMLEDGVRPH